MKKVMLIVALLGLVTLGFVVAVKADDAPPVPIYPAYDVNQDGVVEMMDFFIMANAFGSYPGHARWNPAADVVADGKIEMMDFLVVAQHFSEKSPIIGYK